MDNIEENHIRRNHILISDTETCELAKVGSRLIVIRKIEGKANDKVIIGNGGNKEISTITVGGGRLQLLTPLEFDLPVGDQATIYRIPYEPQMSPYTPTRTTNDADDGSRSPLEFKSTRSSISDRTTNN